MRYHSIIAILVGVSCTILSCKEQNTPSKPVPATEEESGVKDPPTSAPTAGFDFTVIQPLMVQFTNRSSSNATKLVWDFGDGSTSTLSNPKHAYKTTGTYIATLSASNEMGTSSSRKSITISTPKVFVKGVQYNKVGQASKYYRVVCQDDDFFTTTWWKTGYTALLSNSNLPVRYLFQNPVEMSGLSEDDYYTIYVYWNNQTSGDGTQILKQKIYTTEIKKYPESITVTNNNDDTQVAILFTYQ